MLAWMFRRLLRPFGGSGVVVLAGGLFRRGRVGRRLDRDDDAGRGLVRNRVGRRLANTGVGMAHATPLLYVGERREFCFDFTNFPEVIAGETISIPVVPAVTGLTVGTPTVLAGSFTVDADSNTVAAGKGVRVFLTGVTAGKYAVTCSVTASGGGVLVVRDLVEVA